MRVELVDKMGSDLSVVNAARVSYSKVADEMTDKILVYCDPFRSYLE